MGQTCHQGPQEFPFLAQPAAAIETSFLAGPFALRIQSMHCAQISLVHPVTRLQSTAAYYSVPLDIEFLLTSLSLALQRCN